MRCINFLLTYLNYTTTTIIVLVNVHQSDNYVDIVTKPILLNRHVTICLMKFATGKQNGAFR